MSERVVRRSSRGTAVRISPGEVLEHDVVERLFEEWGRVVEHCRPGEARYLIVKTHNTGDAPIYILVDVDNAIAVACTRHGGGELTCGTTRDRNIVDALVNVSGEVIEEGITHTPCP